MFSKAGNLSFMPGSHSKMKVENRKPSFLLASTCVLGHIIIPSCTYAPRRKTSLIVIRVIFKVI